MNALYLMIALMVIAMVLCLEMGKQLEKKIGAETERNKLLIIIIMGLTFMALFVLVIFIMSRPH